MRRSIPAPLSRRHCPETPGAREGTPQTGKVEGSRASREMTALPSDAAFSPDSTHGKQDLGGTGEKPGQGPRTQGRDQPRQPEACPGLALAFLHLSQLGWWRRLGSDLRGKERAPSCNAPHKSTTRSSGRTLETQAALPVRRHRAGTRCHRGGGPGTPGFWAPPAVPWSPAETKGSLGRHPSLKAVAASCADCWSCAVAVSDQAPGASRARQGCAGVGGACSEQRCGCGARQLSMGARALGVGALFVNVPLVLAQDGSLPPPRPPRHPLRLLLLPSGVSPAKAGSTDTQPPRQQPPCAFWETGEELRSSFY